MNTFQVCNTLIINMGMDEYGCLCKCMFIIIEAIVNIEHEGYVPVAQW